MLDDLIAVSGLPGLYKMVANRSNGLIVEAIDTGKRRFCSVRKHQFTPLGSISIYTMIDTIPLKDVFVSIHSNLDEHPIPETNASKQELADWFSVIVPQFDRDRVYPSDIKKLIKWYQFMTAHEILDGVLSDDETKQEEE